MSQPRDARLTPELAREVGQRLGAAATIEGSISALGTQYVVSVKAVNCRDGDLLAQEQVTANGKEHVLKALGQAATKLRKLGRIVGVNSEIRRATRRHHHFVPGGAPSVIHLA